MKNLNTEMPTYYQSGSRFNNNPVEVIIIGNHGKIATVKTVGGAISTVFKCRISSLYN